MVKEVAESRGKAMLDIGMLDHLAICDEPFVQNVKGVGGARFHSCVEHLPELKLSFETSITAWEKISPPKTKVLQLEDLVDKLTKQLKDAENELKQIKEK